MSQTISVFEPVQMNTKKCKGCGTLFRPIVHNQEFHSNSCRKSFYMKQTAVNYRPWDFDEVPLLSILKHKSNSRVFKIVENDVRGNGRIKLAEVYPDNHNQYIIHLGNRNEFFITPTQALKIYNTLTGEPCGVDSSKPKMNRTFLKSVISDGVMLEVRMILNYRMDKDIQFQIVCISEATIDGQRRILIEISRIDRSGKVFCIAGLPVSLNYVLLPNQVLPPNQVLSMFEPCLRKTTNQEIYEILQKIISAEPAKDHRRNWNFAILADEAAWLMRENKLI